MWLGRAFPVHLHISRTSDPLVGYPHNTDNTYLVYSSFTGSSDRYIASRSLALWSGVAK